VKARNLRPWFLVFLFLLVVPVFAEIPVDIKADNLKFHEEAGLVEARGSVEVAFEGVTIYADRLRLNSSASLATAEGKVRQLGRDYSANSTHLTYDAARKILRFRDFKSIISPKNIRGNLYLNASSLEDLKTKMKGETGTLTTCDYSVPHYHLRAGGIEYYPQDKIEGKNATVYVGGLPVLWLPYLLYPLGEKQRKNWLFGHNEVEGDYLKTAWAYPLGLFLLDYVEKKGIGYGTQSDYKLGGLGEGRLYLYHLAERESGISNWIEKIEHRKAINPFTNLKINHSYIDTYRVPPGRLNQTAFDAELGYGNVGNFNLKFNLLDDRVTLYQRYALQFNQSLGRQASSYYYNYEFAKNDPRWLRKSQRLYFSRPIFNDRINFSTATNYYHSSAGQGDAGEERVEPQIEFSGTEKDFSWRSTANWLVDLRQQLYPADTRYEFLEKLPEVEIYPRTLDLKFFSLQPTLGYASFREVKRVPESGKNRDFRSDRLRATLNVTRTIPLGLTTVMLLGGGVDQFAYAAGDQLYALRENASLQTNLLSFFKNQIDFRQGYTLGNTPFFFDQLGTKYHDLREKILFFYQDKFNWTIDGGYNWQTNKYFDVMTQLSFSPHRRLSLNVASGWDIENRIYKDLVAGLRLAPASFYSLDFSLTQNMNLGELRSSSALHNIYFWEGAPNQMYLRFSQVYDTLDRDFKVRDIMIVKDLHCWEMRYSYSDYRKEFSVSFSLKALPADPVGFGTGKGFYYEGFERELREFRQEGEVRRY
jgi:hypothetical protein